MALKNTSINVEKSNERRGVAPIIATLLMVAIAVVGGILIFVFAQGFFNQSDIAPPTADALTIFGYDAKDGATVKTHTGVSLTSLAADSVVDDGDLIAIYVKNGGSGVATIADVKVLGTSYTLDTATAIDASAATAVPLNTKFVVTAGSATAKGTSLINPGEEATVVINYDDAVTGDIKAGKSFKVALITGTGQTFSTQVISGVRSGGN